MAKRKRKGRKSTAPVYRPPRGDEWELDDTFVLTVPIEDGLNEDGSPRVVDVHVELREPSLPELERAGRFGQEGVTQLWDASIVDKGAIPGRYMVPVLEAIAVHFTQARRHTPTDGGSDTDDPMKEIRELAPTG